MLLATGACTSTGYKITGDIDELDAEYVYLIHYDGNINVLDSAKVENETFAFRKRALEQPQIAYLSTDKEQPFARIFLENGTIELGGDFINNNGVTVGGTPANDQMQAFNIWAADFGDAYNITENPDDRERLLDQYRQ